jgi:hypothetical protein
MLDELLSWLRSTIEGDKAAAEAIEDGSAPWVGEWEADGDLALRTHNGHVLAHLRGEAFKPGVLDHIARHDPADTIARCTSELALLDLLEKAESEPVGEYGEADDVAAHRLAFGLAVRTLAYGYKNRPGFDPTLVLDPAELAAIFAGAEERLKLPAKPDDMDQLRARLDALKSERDA